ncbi:hypothetical protein BYT27DRAFT_7182512 [Phlegmacium glaucopus]|nr:hypothetical protein BYT27DRAFT_7182512 [Phlegmacium glaucopus]
MLSGFFQPFWVKSKSHKHGLDQNRAHIESGLNQNLELGLLCYSNAPTCSVST